MANKIFVGGLPFATTEDELNTLFAEYGEIESVNIITDRDSGRSKGFGFVEFADEEGAKAAISAMDGGDIGGRKVTVNMARPPRERNDRGGWNR